MRRTLPGTLWASLLALMYLPLAASAQGVRAQFSKRPGRWPTRLGNNQFPTRGAPPTSPDRHGRRPGPVRLARFSYVHGSVTWRPFATADWSPAGVNLPLRQGAQVWVTNGGRAEVQFDDGSLLRLGNGAIVTLQTLYSDTDGEYTELQMDEGLAALGLRTPIPSFRSTLPSLGQGRRPVGIAGRHRCASKSPSGTARPLSKEPREIRLSSGDYLDLSDEDAAYQVSRPSRTPIAGTPGTIAATCNLPTLTARASALEHRPRRREPRRLRLLARRPVRPCLVPARGRCRLAALPARPLGLGRSVRLDVGIERGLGLGAVPLRDLGGRLGRLGLGSRPGAAILVSCGGALFRI